MDLFPTRPQIRGLSLWRPWPQAMHGIVKIDDAGPRAYSFSPGPQGLENRGWHPPAALEGACTCTSSILVQVPQRLVHPIPSFAVPRFFGLVFGIRASTLLALLWR